MGLVADDDLVAAPAVGQKGDEVALGAAGCEHRRFFVQQLRGYVLKAVHGWVLTEYVIAQLRLGHRPAHLRRRQRDGIATQIDRFHDAGPARP